MTTANSCLVRDHVSLTGMRIETIGIEAGWNRDRDRTETQQVLSHHRALASHPLFTGVLGQCESGGGERINIHRGMDERPDLIYLSIYHPHLCPPAESSVVTVDVADAADEPLALVDTLDASVAVGLPGRGLAICPLSAEDTRSICRRVCVPPF